MEIEKTVKLVRELLPLVVEYQQKMGYADFDYYYDMRDEIWQSDFFNELDEIVESISTKSNFELIAKLEEKLKC